MGKHTPVDPVIPMPVAPVVPAMQMAVICVCPWFFGITIACAD